MAFNKRSSNSIDSFQFLIMQGGFGNKCVDYILSRQLPGQSGGDHSRLLENYFLFFCSDSAVSGLLLYFNVWAKSHVNLNIE